MSRVVEGNAQHGHRANDGSIGTVWLGMRYHKNMSNARRVSRHLTQKGADRALGELVIERNRLANSSGRSSGHARINYDVRRSGLFYEVIEA